VDQDSVFDEPGAISTTLVSISTLGLEGNSVSSVPVISADGRFITFVSGATNFASPEALGHQDIFVHDRDTDQNGVLDELGAIGTLRASQSLQGAEASADSNIAWISGDGRWVAFPSAASNLVSGDTLGFIDTFAARSGFDPIHPAPMVASLSPPSVVSSSSTFLLEVTGSNFVPRSSARWNGANRPTFFVNSRRLLIRIYALDIAFPGSAQVTVVNPQPGGGQSASLTFTIN
jgi:hypothetical protein